MKPVDIPIVPVPKPRMTRSDAWKKRPAVVRYFAFKDELRGLVRGSLEPDVSLVFYLPMPKSWSEKKRVAMCGSPHQKKPDIDNLIKAFLDALCDDDSYVYAIRAEKYWAYDGKIVLTEHTASATVLSDRKHKNETKQSHRKKV